MVPDINRNIVMMLMVKVYDSLTLAYNLAPQLKPHIGWNPCPIPNTIEKANIMQRETIENAAIVAAS